MIEALVAEAAPRRAASPVVLMVSGGSDSTALLVRAVREGIDLMDGAGEHGVDPAILHVLHVNHCLRGADSDADEAHVRALAAQLGVGCTVRRVDVAGMVAAGGNVEEVARLERYRCAWELAGDLSAAAGVPRASARIAVAHTADDRAETFLMRACGGAGAAGLSGMRRMRGIVVRPLLGETRASLRAYLRGQGVAWREDATNYEDGALRSYLRHRAVPVFEARNPSFLRTLGTALDILGDEDDLLERLASRELGRMAVPARPGAAALDAAALVACDPALARRALRRMLAGLLGEEGFRAARLEARHVEALLRLARAGAGSAALPLGVDARIEAGALVVRLPAGGVPGRPAPRLPADAELRVPGRVAWGGLVVDARLRRLEEGEDAPAAARRRAREVAAGEGLEEGRTFVQVDAAAIGAAGPGATLLVGSARAGERMRPFGLGADKPVADVLADARVPARERPWVPVVRCAAADAYPAGGGCVWVGGIRLDERAAYGPSTRVLIELRLLCGADSPAP